MNAIVFVNRWMYFSDWGKDPKIERIGMDGNPASRKAIVKEDIVWPNGLCLDYASERIYWIDAKLKSIFTADLDGSNIHRILHNAAQILHPFSLTVFEVRRKVKCHILIFHSFYIQNLQF